MNEFYGSKVKMYLEIDKRIIFEILKYFIIIINYDQQYSHIEIVTYSTFEPCEARWARATTIHTRASV